MKKFIILIPLFNDWKSASRLLSEIDSETINWNVEVSVIIINDASTEMKSGLDSNYKKIKQVKILNMKNNIVHQRCIATGLKYICENENFDRVIVMDADGEDRPVELNDFFQKAQKNPEMTITGNRYKRSEGVVFKFLYEIHKLLTLVFTRKMIKFGNFSCLPRDHVEQLVQKAYLWNSYSSSVVRTINNRTFIPSIRGIRYVLPSKMNLLSLIFHSLTIISVFKEAVIVRSFLFVLVYLFLIFTNISFINLIPIFGIIFFAFIIFVVSMRGNKTSFDRSQENIGSVDIL